ncbi:unnamed protein product [Lactuca saligna]|uniref:Uncharacterized protein n=1 Tax=Lactuca saligna TaxID=75948 RepID=A0AA35YIS0_LACSI|nr:unnamed protein product [Lactuca saligna]
MEIKRVEGGSGKRYRYLEGRCKVVFGGLTCEVDGDFWWCNKVEGSCGYRLNMDGQMVKVVLTIEVVVAAGGEGGIKAGLKLQRWKVVIGKMMNSWWYKVVIVGGGDKVEFGSIWWCLMVVDKQKCFTSTIKKIISAQKKSPSPQPTSSPLFSSVGSGSNYSDGSNPLLPSPGMSPGFSKSTFTYKELAMVIDEFSKANFLGKSGFGSSKISCGVDVGVIGAGGEEATGEEETGVTRLQRKKRFNKEWCCS